MILTIHQPNFFPWYPFFQKVKSADKFVFLNHSQYQKNYLQNRFSYEDRWFTMSVNKGLDPITTKKYLNPEKDWNSIKNKLSQFKDVFPLFDDCISESLVDTNMRIITKISNILEIKTELLLDYETDLTSTDRLVDICLHFGADTYLSGISGKNYLEMKKFEDKNIKVIFQDEKEMIKNPILDLLKNKLQNV